MFAILQSTSKQLLPPTLSLKSQVNMVTLLSNTAIVVLDSQSSIQRGIVVVAYSITVFDAFPNAIETWQIVPMAYSTITGNDLDMDNAQNISVIVDEGSSSDANPAPNAQDISSDTLIYAKPSEMPTLDTSELVASYAIKAPNGKIFEIVDAGLGKNQEINVIEHVEMKLRQTGTSDES